jgi:hypothetical protein
LALKQTVPYRKLASSIPKAKLILVAPELCSYAPA